MREDGQKTLMRPRVTVAQVSTWKRFHCVNIHPFASGAGSMNFAKPNEPSVHQPEDSKDAMFMIACAFLKTLAHVMRGS